MKGIRKAIDAVYSFLTYFGIITVLAMILIVAFNVFSRLTSGKTIGWGEEVALILMVWFSMIGLALGVKMKLHISIELFTMKLSDRIKTNVINRISNVCSLILGIVMFYFGIKLVQNGMTSTLPATQLPTSLEYIFAPISGFLICINSILDFFMVEQIDLNSKFSGGEQNA